MLQSSLLSFQRGAINAARRYRLNIGLGYRDCVPHHEFSHISSGMQFFILERAYHQFEDCLTFEDVYIAVRCTKDYVAEWAPGVPVKGANFRLSAYLHSPHADGYIRRTIESQVD